MCLLLKSSHILPSSNIRILSYSLSMTTKKTTVLMAAVLAVATVLAAGLAVLPSSVEDAQANPCSTEAENTGDVETEYNCDFEGIGSLTIVEGGGAGLTDAPIILPTP